MSNVPRANGRPNEALFLTTGDFARKVCLSVATVKRLCDTRQIACLVVSDRGDRRIPATEVSRLLGKAELNRVALGDEVRNATVEVE